MGKPWNWRGENIVASNGYVLVFVGKEHHLADVRGYAYEHRLVAEKMLGRKLRRGEDVHHKNHNKEDNRPSNLEVVSKQTHSFLHRRKVSKLRRPLQRNRLVFCRCGCRTHFRRFDAQGRPRSFVTGHNMQRSDHGKQ